jgi:DnaJ-class molecular chaperone
MTIKKDLYKILNVSKKSSQDEIKKAYRKLALEHHPDKGGDSDTFKEITEAYSVLSDPTKRKDYDIFGFVDHNDVTKDDLSNIFSKMFGGSMNGSNWTSGFTNGSVNSFGGSFYDINIEDILGEFNDMNCEIHVMHNSPNIFGKMGNLFNINNDKFKVNLSTKQDNQQTSQNIYEDKPLNENSDLIDNVECLITIDEIIDGNPSKEIKYMIKDICSQCDGRSSNINCMCGGMKLIEIEKTININLSAALKEGEKIFLKGKGSININTNEYNTLELIIRYYDIPKYIKIKGKHLVVYIDLTLKDIFCGFSKKVKIGQKHIDITIDEYINPNNPIIYENCGIKISDTQKGNIMIIIKVKYPEEKKIKKYNKILSKIFDGLYATQSNKT